jgi:hypothetical protein
MHFSEVDGPTPQPSGTQVLMRVKAAGVWHSDLHIWEGGDNLGHGRKPLSLVPRLTSLGECVGAKSGFGIPGKGPNAPGPVARLRHHSAKLYAAQISGEIIRHECLCKKWPASSPPAGRRPDGRDPDVCPHGALDFRNGPAPNSGFAIGRDVWRGGGKGGDVTVRPSETAFSAMDLPSASLDLPPASGVWQLPHAMIVLGDRPPSVGESASANRTSSSSAKPRVSEFVRRSDRRCPAHDPHEPICLRQRSLPSTSPAGVAPLDS